MNELILAYIAGIIDGEGSIFINRKGELVFAISMTHEPTIDWLSARLFLRKRPFKRPEYPNHKDSYQLTACGQKAKNIIETVIPYLITKKEQARLALKYPLLHQGQQMVDENVLQLRKSIYEIMKGLNQRGRNL